jgi:tetratricopeptide (TPR) repeat protein
MRVAAGLLVLALLPSVAGAQILTGGAKPPISVSTFEAASTRTWTIFGQVTGVDGKPLQGVAVRVNALAGTGPVRLLETDLQGKFRTEYELDSKRYSRISVDVVASLRGYLEARDTAEFVSKDGSTRQFRLVLRQATEDPDQLTLSSLIQALGPRLRTAVERGSVPAAAVKGYQKGIEALLADRRDSARAHQEIRKAVEADPSCTPCRIAFSLAQLDLGSWVNAQNHLLDAAGLAGAPSPSPHAAEALLILGVLESWAGQPEKALGLYNAALERRAEDPLVLQEMGRALLAQQNWEAADQYLERAIRAGATSEARVLRVRALLELGDVPEAESEMNVVAEGRQPRDLPAPLRMLHARLQERLELQAYATVKSVVTEPLGDLMKSIPELRGIEPAADQAALPEILRRVGQSVDGFIRALPNTSSREEIREEILDRKGNVRDTIEEKYLYLMLIRPEELPEGTRELRTRDEYLTATAAALKKGFMITSGFICSSLNFHTTHQAGAGYRLLGRQTIDGRPTHVIAFAQRPETAKRVGRFVVDGKSVPVLVQGVAWFDSEHNHILRMRTDLLREPPNSRLKRQTTVIDFAEVRFKEFPNALWLPREVTVTVEWKGKVFRNLHRYTDFRLFKVETEERRRAEVQREEPADEAFAFIRNPAPRSSV